MKNENNNEKWKCIKCTKKADYYISSCGRCIKYDKRLDKRILSNGRLNAKTGYLYFYDDYVHRQVAKAFIDNPHGYEQVDHLNSDRTDNRVENLRWTTRKQNNSSEHARQMHKQNHTKHMHKGQVILACKDDQAVYFKNGREAARKLGCSSVLVYNAINRRGSAQRAKGWTLQWVDEKDV